MLKSDLKGLSKTWKPEKRHTGIYSGGKIQLTCDGDLIACMYGGDVNFLAIKTGDVARRLWGEPEDHEDEEGREEVICFALSRTSADELTTASRNLLLRYWRWDPEASKFTMLRALKGHTLPVLAMDYDGSGALCATGGVDRTVKVWDVPRGYATHNFKGHAALVTAVAFPPDPRQMVVVSGSEDCTVRVWDLIAKKSCVAVFKDHLSVVTTLAFSGSYTLLTGSRDKVVNFWDLRGRRLLATLPEKARVV
eukprot:CAMPEP_0194723290 /NCGR_PEP_ID=MMETSP0296-20130528/14321_1 /TAXON_ID=39354 /ORGANISM="Heterosigma akashiwo, Strain CCMP2393" /LENGTH=250 /DNA_ID=CAMNT_0039626651 /DNA_START=61 /DNA_END=810 /DNA_ORIENTATION=-